MPKVEQKKLVVYQDIDVLANENDVVTAAIPINGLIDKKPDGKVHTVTYSRMNLPRSDGKVVTVQVTAWYK